MTVPGTSSRAALRPTRVIEAQVCPPWRGAPVDGVIQQAARRLGFDHAPRTEDELRQAFGVNSGRTLRSDEDFAQVQADYRVLTAHIREQALAGRRVLSTAPSPVTVDAEIEPEPSAQDTFVSRPSPRPLESPEQLRARLGIPEDPRRRLVF